jgi:Tol biopolymer transport system component
VWLSVAAGGIALAAENSKKGQSPADNLPPHITRLTHFGQRADWSHDGRRILFIEKTYGDVYEIDLATKIVRPVTHHYYHEGYTRALYLANGDILLSGARQFDAENPSPSRHTEAELWVLDKSLTRPPVPLGEKCSEGPAVSRRNMRIAWTIDDGDYPDRMKEGVSQIWMADIQSRDGKPTLGSKKLVLDSSTLPFKCGLETQNFRPPDEKELIFSAYGHQGTDVVGIHLESGKVVNYSEAPNQYDEPEGIGHDGTYTLVECDRHSRRGSQYIDVYKLWLDGSHRLERVTHFGDYPGYKASNPVVSDDGRFIAFQMAKLGDPAGVGRGIFIYDVEKAGTTR